MLTKAEWEKNTIIKDSVHGYINIPKPITREIIDTEMFQRLKNIEQTGMQVLYPSATHNRFVHSLGVYHLSKKAFTYFKQNIKTDYNDVYCAMTNCYTCENVDEVWIRWEIMFQLASLLHDCGHAPFSHTLEFVYDIIEIPETLDDKLMKNCSKEFKFDFDKQRIKEEKNHVGQAHERMSSLFISSLDKDLKGGFRDRIKLLIESYMEVKDAQNIYNKKPSMFDDDIEFMVRMIIGCPYDLGCHKDYKALNFKIDDEEQENNWKIELQMRNCIIGMLNSKLDVDNLDYAIRDSKFSGYASNDIDLERLLSSFTIINAYEFTDDNPLLLKGNQFDGNINLISFKGSYIKAKVSGECIISANEKNIKARGNLLMESGDKSPFKEKMILRTKEGFSANIILEDSPVSIMPKKDKAYINISGLLNGILTGIVLGDTCKNIPDIDTSNGNRHILFAYKQNSMSVLMSAIDACNFENKWIYAHHTTTFKNNFQLVYLLERYTEYITDCDLMNFLEDTRELLLEGYSTLEIEYTEPTPNNCALLEKLFTNFGLAEKLKDIREYWKAGSIGDKEAQGLYYLIGIAGFLDFLQVRRTIEHNILKPLLDRVYGMLSQYINERRFFDQESTDKLEELYNTSQELRLLEMQYFAKIMTMYSPNYIQGRYYYKVDDRDLLVAYKHIYQEIIKSVESHEKYKEFIITYQQMIRRTSMKCLWKTYPEYNFYFSDWTEKDIDNLKHLLTRVGTPWGKTKGEKQLNYSILSDHVTLPDKTKELWEYIKKNLYIKRLVYVEQKIKVKSFKRFETYIKNKERVLRLEDIKLYPANTGNLEFFYIYYDMEEGYDDLEPNSFLQDLRNWIDKESETEKVKKKEEKAVLNKIEDTRSAIIRDNVHGDIILPPFFKRLVDTKEFQRLRRIKQLATAGQVFPGAVHTRFSHSIGTYHIMCKLVNHFEEFLKKLNYPSEIDEIEKKAILAAALLHDLGHGPYSHAFERANLSTGSRMHNEWTIEIITNQSTEIYKVLEGVKEGFAQKVADYIRFEDEIKQNSEWKVEQPDENLNLKFIFATLVSGQIDADRMDYLLRDTEFTGVTYGRFDLDKVIEGLVISVDSMGRYRICFMEKYRSYIEEYFYARYQMYNNVYYHSYKLLSEEIFCKILQEAKKLTLNGRLVNNMLSPTLELIFTQSEVSVDMYCQLDDTVVMGAIQTWSGLEHQPLAYLSAALLERRGYCRLEVVDADRFINKAKEIFGDGLLEKHFLICLDKKVNMYDKSKGIYILNNSGIIKRLQECSALTEEYSREIYIYYSKELAKNKYKIDEDKIEEFEKLIERCRLNNNMEIEKKYVFPKKKYQEIMDSLKKYLLAGNYHIHDMGSKSQVDTYYDTHDNYLDNNDHTLRFREVGDEVYITCKHPVSSSLSHGLGGQLERREEEERVNGSTLDENQEIISRFLSSLSDRMNLINDIEKKIEIKNERNKLMVYKSVDADNEFSEAYEIVFDNVKYINLSNNISHNEYQLEIELKSSYQNRINMKLLTDGLEKKLMHLEPIAESKYKRALRFTNRSEDM